MTTDVKQYTQDKIECTDLTVLISTTTSSVLDLRGKVLVGLTMPSAITSTAITFQGSNDNVTFKQMTSATGTTLSCTVAANKHVCFVSNDFASVRYLKLIMGTTEVAARTIIAVMRAV